MTATPLPEISTSTAGTIVLELDAVQAETLGRILYAYEALHDSVGASYHANEVVEDYDGSAWCPVALALLGEAATVRVPFLPATSTAARGLHLVQERA